MKNTSERPVLLLATKQFHYKGSQQQSAEVKRRLNVYYPNLTAIASVFGKGLTK